jgi:hypothetical protein
MDQSKAQKRALDFEDFDMEVKIHIFKKLQFLNEQFIFFIY